MARVLVPLAEGCEELEAVTIIDLLRRGGIDVVVAGLAGGGPVKASRGVVLVPDTDLDSALDADYDMVVLPGGAGGAQRLAADPRIQALIGRMLANGRYAAAICAAPKALAAAGVLAGRRATSYPGWLDGYTNIQYVEAPVVEDGKIVTSRGPGTAMDFALRLVELLVGQPKRTEVEQGLQRC